MPGKWSRFAILAVAIALLPSACSHQSPSPTTQAWSSESPRTYRAFVPSSFGQIHVRVVEAKNDDLPARRTLVLLHPTPYSSDYFKAFAPVMGMDRRVLAVDTPGYGDSAPPPEPQTMSAYAGAIIMALDALREDNEPYDILGYHTGTLLAAEIAALRPDLIHRLVLPGVPYFTGDAQHEAYERNVKAPTLSPDGAHLDAPWGFATYAVPAGLSIASAQEHFGDMMQCYPTCWWAYHGVFSYPADDRFRSVQQPTLLISVDGSHEAETKAAVGHFSNGHHLHLSGITRGIFDLEVARIASVVRDFLDNNQSTASDRP